MRHWRAARYTPFTIDSPQLLREGVIAAWSGAQRASVLHTDPGSSFTSSMVGGLEALGNGPFEIEGPRFSMFYYCALISERKCSHIHNAPNVLRTNLHNKLLRA